MSSTAVWRPHPHVSGLRDASRIILEHSGSVTPITTTHRACFLLSWLNVTPNREVHRATQLRDLSSSEIITLFPSFFVHENLMKITVIFPVLSVSFKQKNPTLRTTEVCLSQSRTSSRVFANSMKSVSAKRFIELKKTQSVISMIPLCPGIPPATSPLWP